MTKTTGSIFFLLFILISVPAAAWDVKDTDALIYDIAEKKKFSDLELFYANFVSLELYANVNKSPENIKNGELYNVKEGDQIAISSGTMGGVQGLIFYADKNNVALNVPYVQIQPKQALEMLLKQKNIDVLVIFNDGDSWVAINKVDANMLLEKHFN